MSNKPKFKIIKNDLNPYEIVLESTVIDKKWVSKFTIGEIEKHISQLSKVRQEIESKKMVEEAKI